MFKPSVLILCVSLSLSVQCFSDSLPHNSQTDPSRPTFTGTHFDEFPWEQIRAASTPEELVQTAVWLLDWVNQSPLTNKSGRGVGEYNPSPNKILLSEYVRKILKEKIQSLLPNADSTTAETLEGVLKKLSGN